jgi:hypothetical protein
MHTRFSSILISFKIPTIIPSSFRLNGKVVKNSQRVPMFNHKRLAKIDVSMGKVNWKIALE